MTALRPGSPLYDEVFAGADLSGTFVGTGPTYSELVNGFSNPAVAQLLSDTSVTNADGARDLRSALRFAMRDLSVNFGGDTTDVNMPSLLLGGVGQIVKSADIDVTLPDLDVGAVFTAVRGGNPAQVVGAVLGVAMGAVGIAVPVVGLIGAAIVGLATGIARLWRQAAADDAAAEAERRAALFRSFPPLQLPDSTFDATIVQDLLRPKLRTRDWTAIWTPQFRGEWQGTERKGGFAFAQGKPAPGGEDPLFGALDVFIPNGGLGVMPGSDRVTSVLQVSLDFDPNSDGSAAWRAFAAGTGSDPRGLDDAGVPGWKRVQDTGMYYPNLGRIAASLWEMATATSASAEGLTEADRRRLREHGNPLRYRLDPRRLHEDWRAWAEGGLRYIRERCYPWYNDVVRPDGTIPEGSNLEGFFGTAIYDAIGAWACLVSGGTSTKPKYGVYPRPYGILGPELASPSVQAYGRPGSSVSNSYSGSWLPILDPRKWPDQCMGEAYNRGEVPGRRPCLRTIIDGLAAAQLYELRHTLVSAYVSEADAAFTADPKLLDLLRRQRAALLRSEDRKYINLEDVTDREPGLPDSGRTWREQLLAAGVPLKPSFAVAGRLRIAPSGGRPPRQPKFVAGPANPFEPQPPPKPGGGRSSSAAGVVAAVGALGLGGVLVAALKAGGRPRRSFTAGRPQ